MSNKVIFKASKIHQGYYVIVDGEFSGIIVNLYFYKINKDYQKEIDDKILEYIKEKYQVTGGAANVVEIQNIK
jgi:hypothetical protein